MKMIYCLFCHSLRDDNGKLNIIQITAIDLVSRTNNVKLTIVNEVCLQCRLRIGDRRAVEMLNFRKEDNNEQAIKKG